MVSGISNTTRIRNIQNNAPVIKTYTNPALERTPQTDTIEVENKKKKKLSKGAKWAIGTLGTFATLAAAGLAFVAHKRNQIVKLYKEKLVLSNLGENLQFQEAATLEEGMKFTREVLGIKEIDSNISLDAINEVNRALVKVSNANKGKLFMPRALRYQNAPTEQWYASVNRNIKSEQFGELNINSSFFDHTRLNEGLNKDLFHEDGGKVFKQFASGRWNVPMIYDMGCIPSNDVMKLIEKYYQSQETMTIADKRTLYYSLLDGMHSNLMLPYRAPVDFIKKLEAEPKYKEFLERNNIKPNYEELSKKTTKEQNEYLHEILKKMCDEGKPYANHFDIVPSDNNIYHEMGHLQDFAKNLKQLDLARFKFSNLKKVFKESWAEAQKRDKNKKSKIPMGLDEIGNRWGCVISHKEFKKFFDEHPEDFKKCFPDAYEFLTNQEIKQTAGKVSGYAQSGIGEFIAEVYKDMISGKEIPDDVKKLYEKYNGPTLP